MGRRVPTNVLPALYSEKLILKVCPKPDTLLEKRGLGGGGSPERRSRKMEVAQAHTRFPAREGKEPRNLLGKNPFPFHPGAESRIVQPSSPHCPDPVQHLAFSGSAVLCEPRLEERGDGVGEPEQDIACKQGPCLCGRRDDRGHLVIGEARDDRCNHHSCRHAGPG